MSCPVGAINGSVTTSFNSTHSFLHYFLDFSKFITVSFVLLLSVIFFTKLLQSQRIQKYGCYLLQSKIFSTRHVKIKLSFSVFPSLIFSAGRNKHL